MYKKVANILKLIISLYFVFIGVELARIMMEQRPSDLTQKLVIAAVFILAGAGYFLWTLNQMSGNIWGKIRESWERQRQEKAQRAKSAPEKDPVQNKVRIRSDSAMFRTAPMDMESEIIKGTVRMKEEEPEEIPENMANGGHNLPDSWDEATRAMWMEEESEDDSLKRYWNSEQTDMDETEELPGLSKHTHKLPVIPEDTQAILDSVGGATRVIPDISDIKEEGKNEENRSEKLSEKTDGSAEAEAVDYEEV